MLGTVRLANPHVFKDLIAPQADNDRRWHSSYSSSGSNSVLYWWNYYAVEQHEKCWVTHI